MNVAIFGFMGVGKSSVGRLVAEALGLEFVDLDETIVADAGKEIPEIFKERGEEGFRKLEKEATRMIAARDGVVIACGGGTVLDEDNLEALRGNSRMILLTADPETILRRVEADGDTRPLLSVEEKVEPIARLLGERMPRYLKAADKAVDTGGKTQAQVAREIIEYLREGG
ncbi:MAG: shikimate kinase [Candidatus Bathyarchaeota archaeon]|nr:shikimate kinase [Candidatus Bathyarchaeota archaeon]